MKLMKRTTDPQTIYITDSMHRDDIIDITDFDVVEYQYGVMRQTLLEEVATAILIGDGRDEADEHKISEEHVRSIWNDDDLYTIHYDVDIEAARNELQGTGTASRFGENYIYAEAIITAALYSREKFKGTGTPDFFCTPHLVNVMLLARDTNGRRIYNSKADLAAALKAIIDAKAKQADLDTLTGNGEGSISKMIDAAINKFATDVTDDNVVNSYKELIDWVAKHGPEATKMAGGISENKTAIADLKTLVGTLPEGATSTTVVAYITEAINALSIGDYAKTTEVTAAINTALESYYTKTQVDETFVKKTDIVMATDAEVDAMLTEVFGAQATV
jgi:hypothetical protein